MEVEPRKDGPGSPTKFYKLAANSANSANCEYPRGFAGDSLRGELSKPSESRTGETTRDNHDSSLGSLVSLGARPKETRASAHNSLSVLNSLDETDDEGVF